MKRLIPFILALICIVFTGCLKSLDDEGVATGTLFKGHVVENGNGAAIANMRVVVTNGDRQGEETRTATNGSFELTVTHDQMHEGYYLLFSADSLYRTTPMALPNIGYGVKEYDLQVVTIDGPELPNVQTDAITGITQTSAIGGGTVSDDGRSAIRRRGICWNTATNPTIINSHAEAGNGTGHFVAAISELVSGQTYYVRAYAENGVGIAYGQEVVFSALTGAPVVTTATITDVTQNSVTCGGVVTSDNGNAVTARGVCYSSTSVQPTINDAHTSDGSGTGSYTSHITGLQSGTTYYIRAYATNAEGTGYGEVKTVTTF